MKRKALIPALVLALVMLFTQVSFAMIMGTTATAPTASGSLEIVKLVPKDGEKGKQIANMAVKIAFNEAITNTANDAKNGSCIKITAADGTVVKFSVAHHQRYENELWLIVDGDLVADTVYTVEISAGIVADSGNTLASGQTCTFQTRNTKTDSTLSLVLMVVMMVVMIYSTSNATKKAQQEKDADKKPVSQVAGNPYKLAKEQNISLDEAKGLIAKEKEKEAKKNKSAEKAYEKKKANDEAFEAEVAKRAEELYQKGIKRVKAPGSVRAHGHKIPKVIEKKIAAYAKKAKK